MPCPDPDRLAVQIEAAFARTGRPITSGRAARVAREILAYGDIGPAAAALSNDDALGLLGDVLAFSAALGELRDPAALIARLLREAADLDARAEPAWAEGAEFSGRAAFRRNQGESELAGQFERRAEAAERLAQALEAEAFAKRLQAARIQAEQACRSGLAEALGQIAGLAA